MQAKVFPQESNAEDHFSASVDLQGGRLITGARGGFLNVPVELGFASIFGNLRRSDADLNGDHRVDVLDLLLLLQAWGECDGCDEDLDGDRTVSVTDLLMLIGRIGEGNMP